MPTKVRKRDGRLVAFDEEKIFSAIWRAARDIGGKDKREARRLTKLVVSYLDKKFRGRVPTVEDVQDAIEKILIEEGHAKTAKHFILYRQQHKELRKLQELLLDTQEIVRSYIAKEDWRVYENANAAYSLSGLLWHCAGSVMAYYGLNYVYPREMARAHIEADMHGFNGVPGRLECRPPKHLRSAVGQMINFIGTLQNEWAGAQAFSSFDTYLAPFIRYDNLSYKDVKQAMQEFVYNMNVASRWGGQTPFTNITLDLKCPEDLAEQHVTVGGKLRKECYGDFQDEMDMINRALIEVLVEGDASGRVFTFPIPTYNITKDFDWDSEIAHMLFEMTAKYGLPYFQNFINSDLKPSDVRAMCCHLRLDLKELRRNARGGLFGSAEMTGSVGVVTINMPRIGYLSKTQDDFFERLERFMYLAKESLEIKRKVVERNIKNGLLPYTRRYLGSLSRHFSTIGLVGMHEACLNFLGKGIESKEGQRFAIKTLKFMRKLLVEYQKETGNLYNLEATPAEGCSYRLAKKDKERYPDIKTSGDTEPYYTNSTQLPVSYTHDLWLALKHQEPLQELYTGGTVFHVWLGENIGADEARLLVKKIATRFSLPYFTLTPTFSICRQHGYIAGKHEKCPKCKKKTEVYSRVVGYYRPVSQWNLGKKQEFAERQVYSF